MSDQIIKPRPISGFPEWLPEQKLVEMRMLDIIREEFERAGFCPIETPAAERVEILQAKGVESKEIYALSRLAAETGEAGPAEIALHFDLTVPTARYVAQNFSRLIFPFRRYQIQKVWRGERPQAGRFREFYQCDIDIIGNGSLSPINDAEVAAVICSVFARLDIGRFQLRLNSRRILEGLLTASGVSIEDVPAALKAIDARDKVGADATVAALSRDAGMETGAATDLLARLSAPDTTPADLRHVSNEPAFQDGLDAFERVVEGMDALGVPRTSWRFDPLIARGLDYYTGTVYETELLDHPDFGSICSGGRYDNLASSFTKQSLPGVGISIGLTRLLARLFEIGAVEPGAATLAPVLVTAMDRDRVADYLAIGGDLRRAGIATEIYLEPRKFAQQMKYADQKGFRLAIIAGETEFASGTVQVKDLKTGEQLTVDRGRLIDTVRSALAG